MNETRINDKRCVAVAWGLLFLLAGVLTAIPGDQSGIFMVGAGAVLLTLNLVRRMQNSPVNLFSTVLGVLAFAAGLYALARPVWDLPHVQLGFIPLMLIVIGLYVLIPAPRNRKNVG